jgi:hypothetical protein
MKTLHVGIDVAKDSFVTHLKTDHGSSLGKSRSWDYTPQAVHDLETQLINTLRTDAYERVKIGLEATSFYDWHLADTLADSRDLGPYQPQVFRLNALRVSRFHKGTGEVDKTDKVDASIVADFLRMARGLPAPHIAGDPYVPLKRLTRYPLPCGSNADAGNRPLPDASVLAVFGVLAASAAEQFHGHDRPGLGGRVHDSR